MTLYEYRAERDGHGFAGYVEADTLVDAAARLATFDLTDPTYLALVTTVEPGAPIIRKALPAAEMAEYARIARAEGAIR